MRPAKRIETLPPYLFASLDKKKAEAMAKGVDVIDFGVGDPDLPTPDFIVEAAAKAVADPATHRYPSYYGMAEFREAVAAYYERRFSVKLDPETQVLALIGSKEGIAHLATAYVDPGDSVLVPDPGYPVYSTSALLSGGNPVSMPLTRGQGFLPDFEALTVPSPAPKLMWLNYPNNPTAAVCDANLLEQAVEFCRRHDILLAHDAAYVEVTYDGLVAPSLLQVPGAQDVGIEFGSLSKTFNMTGWRVGWAAGSAEAIEALGRVKTNIDSGIFNALQIAGIAALSSPPGVMAEVLATYSKRRDALVDGLTSMGWDVDRPKGSIYVWASVPEGETSVGFSGMLLEDAGVVVAPGNGYGDGGEGYVRFSLTIDSERLDEGVERIGKVLASR